MKHTVPVTAFLVVIFICAQIVGLMIINEYIDIKESSETGKTVVNQEAYDRTGISPPPVRNESLSWIYIIGAVIVGTVLVLLIVKFKTRRLWKLWFFMSVFITLYVAFAPFIAKVLNDNLSRNVTLVVAVGLALYKIFRPNILVHNLTEIFIYGGLAALIVPIINMTSAFALLIAISIYDMYAVWKSKHMVTMAKFQAESKIFAGLMLQYKPGGKIQFESKPGKAKSGAKGEAKSAILGGGDIAFPLLFSGVVLKTTASFINPLIITLFAAGALFGLLVYGKSNRFYPAMPFISAGCFLGFGVVKLLQFV